MPRVSRGLFGKRTKSASGRRSFMMGKRAGTSTRSEAGEKPEGPEAAKVRARKAASVNGTKPAGPMAEPRKTRPKSMESRPASTITTVTKKGVPGTPGTKSGRREYTGPSTGTKPPRPTPGTTSMRERQKSVASRPPTAPRSKLTPASSLPVLDRANTGPQAGAQSKMDRMNAMKAKMSAAGLTPPPRQMSSATSQQATPTPGGMRSPMGAKGPSPRVPMPTPGGMRPPMGPSAVPTPGGMMRPPMGPNGSRPPMPTPGGMPPMMRRAMAGAAGPMMSRMAKGGKAKVSEYGGKEMYTSKAAMMKHEGEESMSMERKEGGMGKKAKMKVRGTGAAKKGNKFNR